ncbi:exosortase-dependent surface protein XDP1 [Teredinibacter turnerae]|uniref:exosortase-dependent surface protein XDP1 n=1 Tax=Teredinibacter turnerae TaxID=2426 RepID=UPI0003669355|nr:exosortase-dependent surface protein XDP1 [Teredinibacter turnerae]
MASRNHKSFIFSLFCSAFMAANASAVSIDLDLSNPTSSYGNSVYNYTAGDVNLSVSGFSYDRRGEIESDTVGNYGAGLGVEDGWSPEHAIDNGFNLSTFRFDYDMLLLSFDQAVSLDSITAGWRGSMLNLFQPSSRNSEASVLAYGGAGTPDNFVGSEWSDLLNDEWAGIGNYRIDNLNSPEAVNAGGMMSRYWLVGAYNPTLNLDNEAGTHFSAANDFWKLDSISVTVNPVPLPGSLLLFGTALVIFGSMRRKQAK